MARWTPSSPGADEPASVRAAQYVRMSTEHQKYSTENQAAAIAKYAEERGFDIIRTYADEGKSGLKLDGREALQRLIEDVVSGSASFRVILVYDVSRWGRFQDPDQAAYLEAICKNAGIHVRYCAEEFENDGSLTATIIKSMKRAMAGEYCRELSRKVFDGQCRLISLGFRQGGLAGYGLRRQLVDEHGLPKAELRLGERKSLQTDRVVLVPGPEEEVRTVRRMYRLFVDAHLNEKQIAMVLNDESKLTDLGRPWTRGTVHQVLTNEKYVGHNVFNRVSFKLKEHRVRNPPDQIVRTENAFEPLIDSHTFGLAAALIAARSQRLSDNEMLQRLANLLRETSTLTALIIDERDDMPSSSAYSSRFGSLLRAYELIGYSPQRDYRYIETNRFLRTLHPAQITAVIQAIEIAGGSVQVDPASELLCVNGEFTVSVVIARCLTTEGGTSRWKIRFDAGLRPDITIAVRMRENNRELLDYYLLPRVDFPVERLRIAPANGVYLDAYRVDTLDAFQSLSARVPVRRTA
ncbi:recombinase family protein [Ancylobacter crimeensis]